MLLREEEKLEESQPLFLELPVEDYYFQNPRNEEPPNKRVIIIDI